MGMMLALSQKQKLGHELLLSVRSLLEDRLENLLDLADRHGFVMKAGIGRGTRVIVSRNNVRFINASIP